MMSQNQSEHWASTVAIDTQGIYQKGLFTVGAFLLVFGMWASLFPLSSAVIAMGSVIPVGQSKTVQHLTGGTVIEIHAVDGQVVNTGDPIITLDPIVNQAELEALQSQYALLKATESRLVAQFSGKQTITFPEYFTDVQSTKNNKHSVSIRYDQLMKDQQREFVSNRQLLIKELSELDQQIRSAQGQLTSLTSQRNHIEKQRDSLNNQMVRMKALLEKGFVARNDADEMERQILQLRARHDGINTEITSVKFRITEITDRKAATIAGRRAEMSITLSRIRGELDTIKSQITAADDAFVKRDIRAPADGILTKSAVYTLGGIIGAGEIIAEIVPAGDYKVEARIALKDIDYVQPGQDARIVVTAFNQTLNDPIPAQVDYVAANSEEDTQTGERFFIARLVLMESEGVANQIEKLRAGMQSDVYITTGERTFLGYIMKPLVDGYMRAFRES